MICPKCQSYMLFHPEAKFALEGWRKCSCGHCRKELEIVKPKEGERDHEVSGNDLQRQGYR